MSRVSVTILVSGQVQGVGYRYFTASAAGRLGLSGTVRNLPDGRVEVVAAGPRGPIDRLIAELRRGPPGARVDTVTMIFSDRRDPAGRAAPFEAGPGFHITG